MSSIFRRLISGKINASPILRPRKFGTAAGEFLRPSSSPYLMLPPHYIEGGRDMVYNFYSPMKNEVVSFSNKGGREETELMRDDKTGLVGSSHGWLALYNSRNRGMCLSNPVSGHRIELPPLAGKPFFMEETPKKVIVSCPPEEEEEECRAVVLLAGGRAALCCPGRSRHWTPLGDWRIHGGFGRFLNDFTTNVDFDNARSYFDFVYFAARKRLVALLLHYSNTNTTSVGREGVIEYWDISEPSCPRVERVEQVGFGIGDLVCGEERNQLFLVRKCMHNLKTGETDSDPNDDEEPEDFEYHHDVYRIGDGGGPKLCSSLDDHAMFVGINHSIAIQFPPKLLKSNCIYYAEPRWFSFFDGQYIEVFNYEKRSCSPLYFPNRHQKIKTPSTWITPTFD